MLIPAFGKSGACPTTNRDIIDKLSIVGGDPNISMLNVQGAPGQAQPLQQWLNNLGTVLGVVAANGNMGLGTSTPDLRNSGSGYTTITVQGPAAGVCGIMELATQQTDADGRFCGILDFVTTANTSGNGRIAAIAAIASGSAANKRGGALIAYTTADNASDITERWRTTNAGYTGFGTSTPGALVDINGATKLKTATFGTEYDNGNSGTAITINWANGNYQKLTLTGNCTLTFTNGNVGHQQLKLIQDATGSRTITITGYYSSGGTAPVPTAAANSVDLMGVFYDGTNYHCGFGLTNSKVN